MCSGQRKQGPGVIEHGSRPTAGCVANRAVGRESGRGMIRIRRLLEITRVATGAVFGRAGKASVHVTLRALHADVCPGERETRHRVVIESSARPRSRGVALLTGSRETGRYVVRIRGLVEVRLVTTNAGCRRPFVLPVHVTLRAHQRLVRSGQRESRCSVIKLRSTPRGGVVALRARGRESSGNVIGIFCIVEISLVTTNAIRWRSFVLSIRMALVACQRYVSTRKSEARHGSVVKLRAHPRGRAVALLASGWKS